MFGTSGLDDTGAVFGSLLLARRGVQQAKQGIIGSFGYRETTVFLLQHNISCWDPPMCPQPQVSLAASRYLYWFRGSDSLSIFLLDLMKLPCPPSMAAVHLLQSQEAPCLLQIHGHCGAILLPRRAQPEMFTVHIGLTR